MDSRYPLSALTGRIIGAAQEVHRALGPGFEELIYQRALARELQAQGLEFGREVSMDVLKGEKVGLLINFGATKLEVKRLGN